MALDELVAAACKLDQTAHKKLLSLFGSAAAGKENGNPKEIKAAALQCLKAAQSHLASRNSAPDWVMQNASLGQASLAALEAQAVGAARWQLLPLRYNFVKRLVAAGGHEAAWQEAHVLHVQLDSCDPPQTAEAANIAVGAVLMLLLCCVEAPGLASTKLTASLRAVLGLNQWLRAGAASDAEKHRDAVFKYLYRAAACLLEADSSGLLAEVVAAMVTIASSETHLHRALQAAAKFAGHASDSTAVAISTAAVRALLDCGGPGVPDMLALDAISLLCTACQRSTASHQASALSELLSLCTTSPQAVVQQAALLLPCLALQVSPSGSSSSSRDARGWVDSTTSALTVAMASAAVLQHACRTKAQLDPWELQGHASVVAAAYQASNLLRKSVAGREPVALVQQLNSEAAVAAVADQFQALGQLVAAAHAVTVAGALKGTLLTAQLATMAKQGHSAVVGLGLAAKLRAACIGSLDGPILSAGAVKVVLGWDFGIFCASGGHLPSSGVLSKQELSWLISALYNLGVDLHGSGNFRAAVPPLLATVSASMCSLAGSLQQCLPPEAVSQHAQDVVKRCIALSDAQARSGDPAAAASSLAHAVVAMVRLGLDPAAWEELLRCLAKQVLDAQLAAKEAVAEAPPAPAPKSKGARVGKGGTNKAKASTAASSRSQSSNGRAEAGMSEVAAPLRCSGILCSFREEVPDTTRAAVAELELSAWATLATSTPAATAECAHLGSFLLNTAFPVHDCPVEHARIMLAAYQACIPLDELSGMELLERAVSLLGHPGQGGLEASIVGARAHSLLALGTAQQLAEQNVQKQQQHAMAAMSAAAAADSSVDRDSFPHITDWAAWAAVTTHAYEAMQHLQAALDLIAGDNPQLTQDEAAALCSLTTELAIMAALHGDTKLEGCCQQQCLVLLSNANCAPGSWLARWACITPASGRQIACMFPGLRPAVAELLPSLGPALPAWPETLAALHSNVGKGPLQLATLAACLSQLSTSPRDIGNVLQRACLHRLAAELEAGAGSVVPAVYHASEAHRLVLSASSLVGQVSAPLGQGPGAPGPIGWWQLTAEQLTSLMQLGRLLELSGMPEEALHAFKEGLRLAVSIGAALLAAAFRVHLADIYSKQGNVELARQALRPVGSLIETAGSKPSPTALCCLLGAEAEVAEARMSLSSLDSPAAWEHCQAAVDLCLRAGTDGQADLEACEELACYLASTHAASLLVGAECRARLGDSQAVAQLAQQACEVLGPHAPSRSNGTQQQQRAMALLALALQPALAAPKQQGPILVWGLQPAPISDASQDSARPSRAKAAAAKKVAGRAGRVKPLAMEPAADSNLGSRGSRMQQLWQAYWLTKEIPHLHRVVGPHLAKECAQAGYLHLAALLLHLSLGATLRQQYRLVLHTKLQQQQHQQHKAGTNGEPDIACSGASLGIGSSQARSTDDCSTQQTLQVALEQLVDPLDHRQVGQLAGLPAALPAEQQQQQPARARRRPQAERQEQLDAAGQELSQAALLLQLEQQAAVGLQQWLMALPEGTVVCSASAHAAGWCTKADNSVLLVSRLAAGSLPLIIELEAPPAALASPSQHPIKALTMDPEDGQPCSQGQQIGSGGGLHRLVDILLRLLEESGQSMRELATDTREQQREWWRTRLALDSQLAALLRTLGEDWLGCWRGLMFGAAADGEQHLQASESWLHRVQHYLEQAGLPPLSEQQCSVALAAIGSVLQSSGSSMGQKGPQEAIAQICSCLGLSLTAEQIAAAEDVPSSGTSAAGFMGEQPPEAASPQKHGSRATNTSRSVAPKPSLAPVGRTHRKDMYGSTSSSREPTEEPAKGRRTRGGKAVSFQLGESPVDEARTSEEPHAHSQIAVSSRAGKAAVSLLAVSGSACSPAWQGSPPREEPGGLCEVFDAMSLQPQRPADEPAAATTARASKTRSRLRMMQASTPGPGPSRTRTAVKAGVSSRKGAATAPRLRSSSLADPESDLSAGAQPLASAENGRASSTVLESSPGPVLLVLDGELQALPWESVPGLQQQRIYRIPSLPCAAASTKRSQRSVNLGSTFYSLNPSGDLSSTQSTFQDWFATLRWEGKAGEPPTATELAKGLQSHQLFVYLGHGGGDQYIPAGKLRSLDSCSAALLMGCSSGRLRLRRHYEPTGPVLAYLLAGCPAAIANLWDVTDKDIDRFSQALLSTWVGEEDRSGAGNNGDSSNGLGVATPTKVDISAAVAASRGACKLPNLIGTAPVCYGVPTAVEPGNSVCQ